MSDKVNHPNHYKLENGNEVIDVIKMALTSEEYRGYLKGNMLKYLLRCEKKNGGEDIDKQTMYAEFLKKEVEEWILKN